MQFTKREWKIPFIREVLSAVGVVWLAALHLPRQLHLIENPYEV